MTTETDWTARLVTLPHECCAPPACIRCGKPAPDGIPVSRVLPDTFGWHGVFCPICVHLSDTHICGSCGGDHSDAAHNATYSDFGALSE